MKITIRLTVVVIVLTTFNLSAATLYVSLESTSPMAPYVTWGTAATNIQHAVDASKAGDTVLVSNGVYAVGERDVRNGGSRVTITNAISLESVNGPLVTTIDGGYNWNARSGGARCVYLGSNAVLSGFTLTNGYAGDGAGVFCESGGMVTNCTLTDCEAPNSGGGAFGGTLRNCTLERNGAFFGGGATGSILYKCTLSRNGVGFLGGGAYRSILYDCSLDLNGGLNASGGGAAYSSLYNCNLANNNVAEGGGAFRCLLNNCILTSNLARSGGGALYSTLNSCTLKDNAAGRLGGGGASSSTLYNCTLSGNTAAGEISGGKGGGAYLCALYNCTLTGNSSLSSGAGGGAFGGMLNNCIVYSNNAETGPNYAIDESSPGLLNHCCTTPLPSNGVGNITGPPMFVDMAAGDFRLRPDSPCIDAGTNLLGSPMLGYDAELNWTNVGYITDPTDMLGNTRFIDGNGDGNVAWDIGAYEFNSFKPPRFTGPPQRTSEGWKFTITGPKNKWMVLQRSSDFIGWLDLQPPGLTGEDGICFIIDADTGPKVMFYRTVVVP